ncbi:MAG: hypothetical protein U1E36_03570 [Rickettsiales bacterium]
MARASIWHRTKNAIYWGAGTGSALGLLAGIAYSLFVLPGMGPVGLAGVIVPPIFGYFAGATAGAGIAAGATLLSGAVGTIAHPFTTRNNNVSYTVNAPSVQAKYQTELKHELARQRKVMRAEMMEEIAENYEPKSKVNHLERLLAQRERERESNKLRQ